MIVITARKKQISPTQQKNNPVLILQALGFTAEKNDTNRLISPTSYKIAIELNQNDIRKSKIDYGSSIKIHHKGTSSLEKPENLVVLECIIRLLKKGYSPLNIELEKTWPLGRLWKGRLDILVRDTQKKAFALIECKCWGIDYANERNKILEDGGQIFTYFVQERGATVLILYSSTIKNGQISFQTEAINASNLKGQNAEEIHQSWDKTFINKSIFSEKAKPYLSIRKNLIKKDLKELDQETGKGVFNSFAEILRRHVVSDKSNAFNKIFNLFVCKICDEDTKSENQELDFQYKINDDYEKLLARLGKLYQKGLLDYLGIETQHRYFNPLSEFAFIDIFDAESFKTNGEITKEVVELLQNYQLKYAKKHQFLGDFFEKLLNTGIKQEAGQFFTPIPLARFILKSIPLESIILKNISQQSVYILPYLLDFACGSGHFLTEAIDEIDTYLQRINSKLLSGKARNNLDAMKNNFLWAREYIYGIEKDYRLAKTTQTALFLNGDGDATIINGDGLDDFFKSPSYQGKLKTSTPKKYNPQFDCIATNPPFSISSFKQYVKNGKQNFSLFEFLRSESSEIECLFIERAAQLLKENGYAGIILPLSILNNEKRIYVNARKILLIKFALCGLVELREKTFSATNTTTVITFLRKRQFKEIYSALKIMTNHFLLNKKSDEVNKILDYIKTKKCFSYFKESELKEKIKLLPLKKETYFELEASELNDSMALVLALLLNINKQAVLAFSGEKKEQERFLGYRFSNTKGREGIEILAEDNKINSLLYDYDNPLNETKVNCHIRKNFLGEQLSIPQSLDNHCRVVPLVQLLTKEDFVINNPSGYFETEHYIIESNSPFGDFIDSYPLKKYEIAELIENNEIIYQSGLIYKKELETPSKTKNKILTASNIDLKTGKVILLTKAIYLKDSFSMPTEIIPKKGDIIISNASGSLKHLGKVGFVEENIDAGIGGFLGLIRTKDEKLAKALFYRLLSYDFRKFISSLKDQNINNLGLSEIKNFTFMLPNDLGAFFKEAVSKENELKELEKKAKNLRHKK